MPFYQLTFEQKIPASKNEVWKFISDPKNLSKITPPSMGFEIKNPVVIDGMYEGQIIEYRVKPLLGIPTKWLTEITHIKVEEFFVDEQRIGPYKMWHHEHHIKSIEGGVLMTDIISYVPPFGFIGALANYFLIGNKLKKIFAFRTKKLIEEFGEF